MWFTPSASDWGPRRCGWVALRAARLLALGALAGCQSSAQDPAPLGNPSPPLTPLGPVPGPKLHAEGTTNPFPHDAITLNAGRLYFQRYNCDGCHGGHAGGGMGPSLRDQEWIYGSDEDQIFDSIAQGRAHGMPAWGSKLPDEVIWKLVAYVQSLRTGQEPEPPDQSIPAPPMVP